MSLHRSASAVERGRPSNAKLTCVLAIVRIGRLEQDLDSVQRSYDRLRLTHFQQFILRFECRDGDSRHIPRPLPRGQSGRESTSSACHALWSSDSFRRQVLVHPGKRSDQARDWVSCTAHEEVFEGGPRGTARSDLCRSRKDPNVG